MKRNRIRVVIYVRVSSKEQVDGYSIGEQIERLEKYADAMEWDIVKTFVDPGYSGGNTDRPGLKEMIKEIETGEIDKVVVYKLDRLSRSQLDTLYLIEKVFLANNTDFVSMSENFDTSTPFGRAMIGILAVFAQLEREQIKERTMIGKEARAKEGKFGGGTEPIGYDYNIPKDLLEVNEYEAMQVRELFDIFLKGTPLRTIELMFLEKGYSHKHGVWDSKAMRRVLKNKIYLGYLRYHDNYYKAEHTPILSEETFERAQELLKQREEQYKEFYRKPGARTTYLGGMLYCKHCGGKYAKQLGGSAKYGKLYYYCCYSRSKKVRKMVKDPNCINKNWRMEVLDEIVLNEIKKLAMDPEYINTLKEATPVETETPDKIKIIQDEIKSIDEQISRFMDLYGIGKFTIEQVSQKIDPLNDKRSALEKELNKLNSERGAIDEEKVTEILNSFEDVLERGEFDEIRLVIESLIYYIELDNDDVYIHWKFA